MKTAHVWMLALIAVAMAWLATTASAVFQFTFEYVNNDAGGVDTDGFYTWDLVVTSDTDWLASNMILTLSQGSLFQSAFGGNTAPPAPAIVTAFPSSAFDTYVSGKDGAAASSAGGAVDIGGTALGAFSDSAIDINWFTTTTDDIGTFTVGRFTVSTDANGAYTIRMDTAQHPPHLIEGYMFNGSFTLWHPPEPASLSLLGIGALVVLGRNRAGLRR